QGGQKPCANWQLVWVWARRTIKIAYCFDVVSNTLRSEARLNSLSVGGPWPGVVLIHHMPGWDEWIKPRKEKASERRVCWRGGPSGSGRLLIAGKRLHPEGQPRELFGDNPQLVLRASFVAPIDQPDQRADMLLGQLKETLGGLGRHQTSSGRTAMLGHDQPSPGTERRQRYVSRKESFSMPWWEPGVGTTSHWAAGLRGSGARVNASGV